MRTRNPLLALLALLLGAPVAAAPNPATVAVSPGGAGTVELAGSACPTFSWSAAAGATGYELVAYALDPSGETGAEPALRVALPAGVTSWSPSGSQCLAPPGDRGRQGARRPDGGSGQGADAGDPPVGSSACP